MSNWNNYLYVGVDSSPYPSIDIINTLTGSVSNIRINTGTPKIICDDNNYIYYSDYAGITLYRIHKITLEISGFNPTAVGNIYDLKRDENYMYIASSVGVHRLPINTPDSFNDENILSYTGYGAAEGISLTPSGGLYGELPSRIIYKASTGTPTHRIIVVLNKDTLELEKTIITVGRIGSLIANEYDYAYYFGEDNTSLIEWRYLNKIYITPETVWTENHLSDWGDSACVINKSDEWLHITDSATATNTVWIINKNNLLLYETVSLSYSCSRIKSSYYTGVFCGYNNTALNKIVQLDTYFDVIREITLTANMLSSYSMYMGLPFEDKDTPVFIPDISSSSFKYSKNKQYPNGTEPACKVNYLIIGKINE